MKQGDDVIRKNTLSTTAQASEIKNIRKDENLLYYLEDEHFRMQSIKCLVQTGKRRWELRSLGYTYNI